VKNLKRQNEAARGVEVKRFTHSLFTKYVRFVPASPFLREMFPLAGVAMVVTFLLATPPDIWRKGLYNGVIFSAGLIAVTLGSMYSLLAGLCFFVFSVLASNSWATDLPKGGWQELVAGNSFGLLWAVVLPLAMMRRSWHDGLFKSLFHVAMAECFVMLIRQSTIGLPFSFMNNGAADASMLAVLLPVWFYREDGASLLRKVKAPIWFRQSCFLLVIFAVGVTGSSTGTTALIFSALAWLAAAFRKYRYFDNRVLAGIVSVIAMALVSIPFYSEKFLNDSGRFNTWKVTTDYFFDPVAPCLKWAKTTDEVTSCHKNYINPIFGAGSGSFQVLGPRSQLLNGATGHDLFLFAHNEYLQIFFEQGAIGLVVFLAFGLQVLWRARNRPWLFSSLATYAFIMLTQFPFRFFPSAFIGALLVREALEKTDE
jgi:uncharacterized membrane protein